MEFLALVGKFVGAGAIAIVVLIVLLIVLFRWWIKRKVNAMVKEFGEEFNAIINPARLELTPLKEATPNQLQMNQKITEAEALGFHLIQPNGVFETNLTGNVFLYFFQNADRTMHMLLFDNEDFDYPRIELVRFYKNRTVQGVTNRTEPILPYPKNIQIVGRQGASMSELFKYADINFLDVEAVAMTGCQLMGAIEQVYGMQQDYMVHLNFADYNYVRGQLENDKAKGRIDRITGDMVEDIQKRMRDGYEYTIPTIIVERFLKEQKMDALTWQNYDDHVIVIHERQTAENLWHKHLKFYFIDMEYDKKRKETIEKPKVPLVKMNKLCALKTKHMTEPLKYMEVMVVELPEECDAQLVGIVNYPLKAAIYYLAE